MRQAEPYLASDVPFGEHLADQLLLPMALRAGRFLTLPLSSHAETNIRTIERFLDVPILTCNRMKKSEYRSAFIANGSLEPVSTPGNTQGGWGWTEGKPP